jgi:hypothetical protein
MKMREIFLCRAEKEDENMQNLIPQIEYFSWEGRIIFIVKLQER